jgi:hypothetical protein
VPTRDDGSKHCSNAETDDPFAERIILWNGHQIVASQHRDQNCDNYGRPDQPNDQPKRRQVANVLGSGWVRIAPDKKIEPSKGNAVDGCHNEVANNLLSPNLGLSHAVGHVQSGDVPFVLKKQGIERPPGIGRREQKVKD